MSEFNESVKTIDYLERLRNSADGNPRFEVYFTDNTHATTKADAQINYRIENREFRGVPLRITTDQAGLITKAIPATDVS